MKDPKISVIIPVYNVEKYLRRCVDSVLNQTYRNLEVILVDDGSPDGCPAICDEYAEMEERVKVVHKTNGGLSSARNAGLDSQLEGDFIAFVDSDDWIEPDTYQYCTELIERHSAECVQYEVNITNSEDSIVRNPKEQVSVYSGKDALQYFMYRSTIAAGGYSVWGGVYNRKLLEGIRFRDGKINEDIDYKCKAMMRCQCLVVTNQKKYNYFQGIESISSGGLRSKDFQLREAAELLAELTAKETYGTIAFLGQVKKARTAFSLLSKIAYFGIADAILDKRLTVRILTKEHRNNLSILLKAPLPISRKFLAFMFAINFKMTEIAIHLAKKL